MADTYNFIASTTLSSGAATITFSSIPQDYDDLIIHFTGNYSGAGASYTTYFSLNNDTGISYTGTAFYVESTGNNYYPYTPATPRIFLPGNNYSSNLMANWVIQIFKYSTTSRKTMMIDGGWSNGSNSSNWNQLGGIACMSDQAAITRLDFYTGASNYGVGTTISIYGIKNS